MTNPLEATSITLFGPPGVGKTQLAASFPKPLFIGYRPGKRYVKAKKLILGRGDFDKYMQFCEKLPKFAGKIETLVVDLAADLYNVCWNAYCEERGVKHPQEDGGMGNGWGRLRDKWHEALQALSEGAEEIGATVIFIGHSETIEVDMISQARNQTVLKGTKQVAEVMTEAVEHAWFMGYDNDPEIPEDAEVQVSDEAPRVLYTKATSEIWSKNQDPDNHVGVVRNLPKTGQYDHILTEIRKTYGS